ncbi:NUMOD4 motif-containing HNH endonuclease [Paraburkholderia sp.]|uniref:NUMOD4 motif-containing HNH endonuclease n=1 Tax=Paraburkholderia sp. TaxID=1926495 RepID=UPI00239ACDE7|nr:NUMOD4 motif-containing HNH endonuclease [Paraburkholderia sp.]MDE1179449.1 NUMOD4 motif-containing HNH endonuclease [Paraburkholderia sp.]
MIAEFPQYEVSSFGRVRRGASIKKPRADRKGYLSVTLWSRQKPTKRALQRLVAAAFIGPRPDGMVVRHRNGINADNRHTNLVYGTATENEFDKIEHGTQLRGEKHHQAKLTEAQVFEIRRRFKRYDRRNGADALAREFGVTGTLIYYIVIGKLWSHLLDTNPAL